MNLSMGAGLALLLLLLRQPARDPNGPGALPPGRWGNRRLRVIVGLIAFLAVGATTVCLSLSRGGILSMLIAAGVTALVLGLNRRRSAQAWLLAVAMTAAFACVLYAGFDTLYDRMATLSNFHETYQSRWQIVLDIVHNWKRFPLVGTGLGTHEVVYPMLDTSTITSRATHAENEYAQMLEETGAAGVALIAVFLILTALAGYRAVRRAQPAPQALAAGLGFGLTAILIHSFSDFGQHLPANAMLSAVYFALILNLGRLGRAGKRSRPPERRSDRAGATSAPRAASSGAASRSAGTWRWAIVPATATFVFVFAFAAARADAARRAGWHWRQAHLAAAPLELAGWHGDASKFSTLLTEAHAASASQPDNIVYRTWYNVYRWYELSADWNGRPEQLDQARDIVADLQDARPLCPVYGPDYSLAGQIRFLALDDAAAVDDLSRGSRLARCDVTASYYAGLADARLGRWDASLAEFRRCRELGEPFDSIADVYIRQTHRPDLALRLAGDDPAARLVVASLLERIGADPQLAASVRRGADAARRADLLQRSQQDDADPGDLAAAAALRAGDGDDSAAVELYRRALAAHYARADWHLALAQALVRTDRPGPALEEARACLRLSPDIAQAKQLVARLAADRSVKEPASPGASAGN